MRSLGYYTLIHAGSGLTMLGSTAAGASAAGTVGIIAGTGGVLGTMGAILMAPATIVTGAVALTGGLGYEGVCPRMAERITDPALVREVLVDVAAHDHSVSLVRTRAGEALQIVATDGPRICPLDALYDADKRRMHRDWFRNTDLGQIVYNAPEAGEVAEE